MRAFVAGAILALVLAVPAFAEEPAAPPPDDSHMVAALDLLNANGSITNLTALLDAIAPVQAMEIQHQQPDLTPEQVASLQSAIRNAFVAHIDELKRIVAAGYAAHFSEDELHTLASFYRSDVGKKYVSTIPSLVKELAPAETRWAIGIAQEAVQGLAGRSHNRGEHT